MENNANKLYDIRENIINELSGKEYLRWVKKTEKFKNLVEYLSENVNAYISTADKKIGVHKLLDYANNIIDSKIKDRKVAEKEYLDKLNYDRDLFYNLKNRDRDYERWFDLYYDLIKYCVW